MTTKDGVQFEKDLVNNKYGLIIPKVNPSVHSGLLIVKATNLIGSVDHQITFNVLGFYYLILLYFIKAKNRRQ